MLEIKYKFLYLDQMLKKANYEHAINLYEFLVFKSCINLGKINDSI